MYPSLAGHLGTLEHLVQTYTFNFKRVTKTRQGREEGLKGMLMREVYSVLTMGTFFYLDYF